VWCKIHLLSDEETLEVRAVEITGATSDPLGRFSSETACLAMDAPVLSDLLSQIPEDHVICSVSADGA
jgi:hypothetical protein